ncbi:peptidylprolyl isomerase [Algisphaera agarilytica]|uniref:Peptidyl-prolyl cis-trans isomerase n=1 Tax=Algisphaera agarilytica TaxID=1385975 RepID=A0A7X0LJB1_9BACT|nr:peptidylprolyl isomerase [Algisphaera agarilytica]MBB6428416.1 cyclophilin family peptidyl-prolyl cis-trans isomerase [Algisphaera agarilytica]
MLPRLLLTLAVLSLLLFISMQSTLAHPGLAGEAAADRERPSAEAFKAGPPTQEDAEAVKGQALYAVFETTKGRIILELYTDDAPLTVANFKNLADAEFYDGITFHRVIPDFMIQGGDPTGTGRGGPGYKWDDEQSALDLKHDGPGILSMANAGKNTNGSQFFITHRATPHLNGKHAVFGRVIQGQNVVDAIRKGDQMTTVRVVNADDLETD